MFAEVDHQIGRLLPWPCLMCGLSAGAERLCAACRADLPWILAACDYCARPLSEGGRCGRCDLVLRGLDRVRAALAYEYPVDALVAAAKFQARPEFARALGELLVATCLSGIEPDADLLLLPVPLHPRRQAARGFNQAVEMAQPLARALGCEVQTGLLRRCRHTPAQSVLSGAARRRNLRNAFEPALRLRGRAVLLIDDVVTTGTTLSMAARALRRAGATQVEACCLARTVRLQPAA